MTLPAKPNDNPPLWPAYRAWRAAAGPFGDYVLPTPFLAPWTVAPRRPTHPRAAGLVEALLTRLGAPSPTLTGWGSAATPLPPSPRWGEESERARLTLPPPAGEGWGEGSLLPFDHNGTALVLEASPRLGLAALGHLARWGWWVVPMLGRWPAPQAVLPIEPLLPWLAAGPPSPVGQADWLAAGPPSPVGQADWLTAGPPSPVGQADWLTAGPPSPVGQADWLTAGQSEDSRPVAGCLCLLLDAERSRRASPARLRRRFDNRYSYAPFMLPTADHLVEAGIRRLLWCNATGHLPPDAGPYVATMATTFPPILVIAFPST